MRKLIPLYAFVALVICLNATGAFFPINKGMVNQATVVTKTTGTTTLVASSNQVQIFIGAAAQTLKLPNAQNLPNDWWYRFVNTTPGTISVVNNGNTEIGSISSSRDSTFFLKDNSTTNGTWYQNTSVAPLDLDHGVLAGLGDDDHPQYHNDTRGDARYFRENEHINVSVGVLDAGKPVVLNASGLIDASMVASGSGTGDVVGPASSTDLAIARFDGITGKLIQNSNVLIDDIGNISTTSLDFNYNSYFGGKQVHVKGDSAMVRVGSSTADGDPVNEESYGFLAYGTNLATDPMDATNYASSYLSDKVLSLNTYDTSVGVLNGPFIRLDQSGIYMAADNNAITLDINRNTGVFDTAYGIGFLTSGATGIISSTAYATDSFTQYLLLAGRSGGQYAYGGTGSGDDLDLDSTSHATKGEVRVGGGVMTTYANTRVGFGTTATPTYRYQFKTNPADAYTDTIGLEGPGGGTALSRIYMGNSQMDISWHGSSHNGFGLNNQNRMYIGSFTSPTHMMNLARSETDTTPLTPSSDAPIMALRNITATVGNYSGLVFEAQSAQQASSIIGVTEVHTGGAVTGRLEVNVSNAGVMQEALQIDADMDAHFSADVNAASVIKTQEAFIAEDPDGGTNTVTIQASTSLAGNYTLTLPLDDGTLNQVLTTDGSGVLSWTTPSAGSSTLTQSKKTANYSLANSDDVIYCNSGTAQISITLHSAATATSKPYRIKNINSQSCFIVPSGGDYLIGGTVSLELAPGATSLDGPALTLIPDGGSLWSIF